MGEGTHPSVFTIPPHRSFADALAAGLIARFGRDPLGLARGLIIVPNGRAARAIQDGFVRLAEPGLMLPRFAVIGDADLDEAIGTAFDPLSEDIPPAIPPTERLMLLTRLVRDHSDRPLDASEALRLAEQLGRAFDALSNEGVLLSAVKDQEPAELSERWQQSYALFLKLAEEWPKILVERGQIDLAMRRNQLMEQAARHWQDKPPAGFVVAAGITIAVPAVANLLKTIAFLPNGMIVFPALDTVMPEAEWDSLAPDSREPQDSHPQHGMRLVLDRMGIGRSEVHPWAQKGGPEAPHRRETLISNAFAPAQFTSNWVELGKGDTALKRVKAIEATNSAEEAQAVAILMRQALETPERRVALVTPDRGFAARVSALLGRWEIEADDSAGRPLSATAPGSLILALAHAAKERFAPLALLSLVKHPLVSGGIERLPWLDGARSLDRLLRGPRPGPGLAGIDALIEHEDKRLSHWQNEAKPWWAKARLLLEPLDNLPEQQDAGAALDRLCSVAEALAGEKLWAGPAGRALASLWEDLRSAITLGLDEIDSASLVPLLRQFFDAETVRPPQGGHPRVAILGLLESRLQHFDLVIASCLNEGSWPSLPAPDPWLAPALRRALGLPGLEQRIGQSAHVLQGLLGAPEVVLTRAQRDLSGPTIASRFWLRMQAMSGGIEVASETLDYAAEIDRPALVEPAKQPKPLVPAEHRPKQISVTQVDRIRADPYSFYAQKILNLSLLDAVDADPSAAWRGNAVHDLFEHWAKEDKCDPDALRTRAANMLSEGEAHPLMRALWAPRLEAAVEWAIETMAELRAEGRDVIDAEIWGEAEIDGVRLSGKIDRIDRMAGGSLGIVDYKTGKPPSTKMVAAGYSIQLGLLGLIAEQGGFEGIDAAKASAFEYWSLSRSKGGGFGYIQSPVRADGKYNSILPDDFVPQSEGYLREAIARWLNGDEPFTARLNPDLPSYADYDQLMRLEEWFGRGAGGADG